MKKVQPDTPLMMLTVSQFEELLSQREINTAKQSRQTSERRYVYGLKGICSLFNCSHSTAQKLKDHVIAEAVSQNERKIVVDVDLAIELFNSRGKKLSDFK